MRVQENNISMWRKIYAIKHILETSFSDSLKKSHYSSTLCHGCQKRIFT